VIKVVKVIEEGKLGGPQVRVAAALKGRAKTLIVMPHTNSGLFHETCAALRVPWRALARSGAHQNHSGMARGGQFQKVAARTQKGT